MTDETAVDDEDVGEELDGEDAPKKKLSGRTLVLFIILPAVLVLGGLGGAYMMGMFGGGEQHAEGENGEPALDPSKVVFYELPELVVNLRSDQPRGAFVKFRVTLELHDPEMLPKIEPLMPRILDKFQIYLRELRTADLEGSAGLFRLKEEILRRINMDVRPYKVADVLFTEMIVQ